MFAIVGIVKSADLTYCTTDPPHPKGRGKKKIVPLHVVKAENALGRLLRRGEKVVHLDGRVFNNDPANLAVLYGGQTIPLRPATPPLLSRERP